MPVKKAKNSSGKLSGIVRNYDKPKSIGKSGMKKGGVVRTVKKRDGNEPVKIY